MSKNTKYQLPLPPIFGVKSSNEDQFSGNTNKTGIISLDDIFDEFLFSNENNKSSYENYEDDDEDDDDDDEVDKDGKKRKRNSRNINRSMTNEQKVERRF
jgi:hypothetical protein